MEKKLVETERLVLRNICMDDLDTFLAYRNDPQVARYQSWWPNLSREYGIQFIKELQDNKIGSPGKWNQISIIKKDNGLHVGDCALNVKEDGKQAEIGFSMASAYQGQGYAFEAVSALLEIIFLQLNLHRVYAVTDCKNSGSIQLLKRLDMRCEGHFVENIWFKGQWGSEFLFAILRKEWILKNKLLAGRE